MGIPLIEDNPYGDLCYSGEPLPKLLNMNPEGVIYLGSFSKILTPGIRLGYIVAPLPLIRKLEQAKQATDLHTATLTQMAVYEVIKDGFLQDQIANIRRFYSAQCDVMLEAMGKNFPEGVTWTRPLGGMFIWVTLPKSTSIAKNCLMKRSRIMSLSCRWSFLRERTRNQYLPLELRDGATSEDQ